MVEVTWADEKELQRAIRIIEQILGLLEGLTVSQALGVLKESRDWLLDSLVVDGNQELFILKRFELRESCKGSS